MFVDCLKLFLLSVIHLTEYGETLVGQCVIAFEERGKLEIIFVSVMYVLVRNGHLSLDLCDYFMVEPIWVNCCVRSYSCQNGTYSKVDCVQ